MKKTKANILIVDDDPHILFSLQTLLERFFSKVFTEKSPERIPSVFTEHNLDAVILDMNYSYGETSGKEGLEWIKKILEIDQNISVVPITAYGGVDDGAGKMSIEFFSAYENSEKLGQMMTQAQNEYITDVPYDGFTVQEFTLLGDPSLMIGGYP